MPSPSVPALTGRRKKRRKRSNASHKGEGKNNYEERKNLFREGIIFFEESISRGEEGKNRPCREEDFGKANQYFTAECTESDSSDNSDS